MTIQENIQEVKDLTSCVKIHPCCFELKECKDYYFAICPEGFNVDGVRVCKSKGKINALNIMIARLEKVWKDSSIFN